MTRVAQPLRVAVFGAGGRMGRGLIAEIGSAHDTDLVTAIEHPDHPSQGLAVGVGDICLSSSLDAAAGADVIIDFSLPGAVHLVAEAAARLGVALVTGTTGTTDDESAALREASAATPVLAAPNMSVGVNVLLELVKTAVTSLGDGWDLELMEIHHGGKKDAPSGTALALARAAADARGVGADALRLARAGAVGARTDDEIGVVALRGGDVAGEHTLYLLGAAERLELTHRATDRIIFVRGALRAARWIVGRPPGLYGMRDVLFGS